MNANQQSPRQSAARALRAAVAGVVAGYAVILGVLLALHPDAMTVISDMAPFFVIGGVGIALSVGPLALPGLQARMPITGQGLGDVCAQQSLAPQRVLGLMAMGMMFGALLHQLVKLIVA